MKKLWDQFSDKFGITIIHPQMIMKGFTSIAITEAIKIGKRKPEQKIIDIGCGRAPYKSELIEYYLSYVGVDHPKYSEKYESENKPDVLADAASLPFDRGKFDVALMLQVLEYLPEPQAAIDGVFRVLKKDGIFILSTPFMYPIHNGELDRNRFTKTVLIDFLKRAGFKSSKINYQGNFFDFVIQSFLVFYFKRTQETFEKGVVYRMFGVALLLIGLVITIPLNLLAKVTQAITSLFPKYEKDFPLNIIAIAKK